MHWTRTLEHAYSCSTDLKALRRLNCSSFALCQLPRIQPNQALQTLKLKMKSGSPYGPVAIGHLIAEVFRPRRLFCRSAWAGSSDSTSSRAAQTLVSRGPDAHHPDPPVLIPNLCIDRLTGRGRRRLGLRRHGGRAGDRRGGRLLEGRRGGSMYISSRLG